MIFNNIVETIGKTPVIKLRSQGEDFADIYVKLESFNPGGSVKDRAAISMINTMIENGKLKQGDTIVEPTSGNTGIGASMIAAGLGFRIVLVMPETMSVERRKLLLAYGAELILTEGAKGMKGAIEKANQLVQEEGYVMLSQFDNPANPQIHRETTAVEILADFDHLDGFVAGIGTGGTITGVGNVLKDKFKDIKIVGVEPEASPVISGGAPGPHKIQGIGPGFVPANLDVTVIDEMILISNDTAFEGARDLAKKEGILVGISSGAAFKAALKVAKDLGKGKKVLFMAPDTGERYLSMEVF